MKILKKIVDGFFKYPAEGAYICSKSSKEVLKYQGLWEGFPICTRVNEQIVLLPSNWIPAQGFQSSYKVKISGNFFPPENHRLYGDAKQKLIFELKKAS